MIYHECSITTSHEAEPLLTEALLAIGAEGISTEDPYDFDQLEDDGFGIIKPDKHDLYTDNHVTIKAYFEPIASTETLTMQLQEVMANYGDHLAYNLAWQEVNSDDWALNDSFEPIQLLDHLYAVTANDTSHEQEEVIYIEPGMAFGTGDHPTTQLAITFLAKYIKANDIVFDVGTGAGIIALAAAKLGAKHIYAYDLDTTATDVARHHVAMNHLESTITVAENNLLEGINDAANIIVANIVTPILVRLMKDAYRILPTDGYLILSGIQAQEANTIYQALEKEGFYIADECTQDNWTSILASKKPQIFAPSSATHKE